MNGRGMQIPEPFFYFWYMYKIKSYTKRQAKKLKVTVKPSRIKGKKIDVFKKGKKVASIGAKGYNDYPTLLKKIGKVKAEKRRKAYKLRHRNNINVKGTPGYYAGRLLW